MKTARNIVFSLALPMLISCGSKSSKTADIAPISQQKVATQPIAATQVSAQVPKPELSPEELQVKHGQKVYRKCKSCHTVEKDGRHRVGPNLYDVLDAKIASKDGFAYSKAFQASDVIWTDENLDAFLKKPKEFLPKNRMTFVGLKKEEDRAAVIAYLRKVTTE